MSFINLVANVTCPQYSHLYMVETKDMRDLRVNRNAHFQGVVGILPEHVNNLPRGPKPADKRYARLTWLPIAFLPTTITILIIQGLTKFQPGSDSTSTQLAASQIWLTFGGAVASIPNLRHTFSEEDGHKIITSWPNILIGIFHIGMGGAIIWCVYVSMKMLWDYGSCTLI